ncbi:unnamed protein product [Discula destructiva]
MSDPDDPSAHQHRGKPRGTMIKLHGLDTYAVHPPDNRQAKGVIIIIPDAHGIESISSKLLADTYATRGDYKVYLPDFMRGQSCPGWFLDTLKALMAPGNYLMKPYHLMWGAYAFIPWMYHNRHTSTFPTVKAFFQAFRRDEGSSLPVGVAGFSWGGKHALLLTHQDNFPTLDGTPRPMVDAAFIGHPTSVDVPRDFEKMRVPVSFAIPERDHHVRAPAQTDLLSKVLESKAADQRGELHVYAGCAHGFCVRSDFLSAGSVETQAVEAEDQAIAWFNSRLGLRPLS